MSGFEPTPLDYVARFLMHDPWPLYLSVILLPLLITLVYRVRKNSWPSVLRVVAMTSLVIGFWMVFRALYGYEFGLNIAAMDVLINAGTALLIGAGVCILAERRRGEVPPTGTLRLQGDRQEHEPGL
ncbi:hypothetical protein [Streptosporangium sp. NPDC001681]|uniref:hypothetical protein n=1 Tax=Streptosporangium sp. NPDC001681 TaxID=3154395 RepID=UPI003318E519